MHSRLPLFLYRDKESTMNKSSIGICAVFLALSSLAAAAGAVFCQDQFLFSPGHESITVAFRQFSSLIVGDWQHYGRLFITWQPALFRQIFLWTIVSLPLVFLLHYLSIGPKSFSHQKGEVFYFGVFSRIVHWIAAVFFSLLVLTGLTMVFGKLFGGGAFVRSARYIHIISALIFAVDAPIMFLIWVKDMLPMPYDLKWFLIMGGYLSRAKRPVPAGRFNAGQKIWFWLSTLGGGFMAWTGYQMFSFDVQTEALRFAAIVHNFLGAALAGFFIIHLYMSLFAIKGSLQSMLTGYKSLEEVEILHSRYKAG